MRIHATRIPGSLSVSGSWHKTITSVKDSNPKPE